LRAGLLALASLALVRVPPVLAARGDAGAASVKESASPLRDRRAPALTSPSAHSETVVRDPSLGDSLLGFSGALRARFLLPDAAPASPLLASFVGDSAMASPGVYPVATDRVAAPFHVIVLHAFAEKVNGRIGAYRIGAWSAERRAPRSPAYSAPAGFIEVTPDNQDTHVSEHFRLRDFLTKDQQQVWPKYLVLDEALLDKLELLRAELVAEGLADPELAVMSGFRTPQYNAQGVGAGGRASESRHQFGDAADVYIRGRGDRMPDLTGDGKIDTRDARHLARAVERVEARYPALAGGIGIYPATSAHGPFVHVDVRGTAARWGSW
jgi:uncharacterized protein YcbK (DUF882 family)